MNRIAIIFPDEHLPYSPTLLNLRKSLAVNFDTHVIGFSNRQYAKMNEDWVRYLAIPFVYKKWYGLINKFSKKTGRHVLAGIKKKLVREHLASAQYDILIVTDLVGLWMVEGLRVKQLHLLSLELTWNTFHFYKKVNIDSVNSIIIQSEERLRHLAPHFKGKVFFVQNAPFYTYTQEKASLPPRYDLVFTGTAYEKFGFIACLEFLENYPRYRLTLQGKLPEAEAAVIAERYKHMVVEGRLMIETSYLDEAALLKKIASYRIGFCLYDFACEEIDNINYRTAPSGKMFTSFAAGVPVVGIDVPGLKPVTDFNAGSLIANLEPSSIKGAIDIIEEDYDQKVLGCYRAAAHYNFAETVAPFINYLLQST
jgi:hypothetical protein